MKYYMHVNFLERIFPLEEIIRRCAAAGYDGIELRCRDGSGQRSLTAYLEHMGRVARENKLDLVFGGSSLAHDSNADARAKSLDELKTLIRTSAGLGVKILNVFTGNLSTPAQPYTYFEYHGSTLATEPQWAAAVDFFQQAGDVAADQGVTLCFETHNVYLHDLAEPTARLLDRINRTNVKANWDFGNIYLNRRNQGLDKELAALSGKIGYVHLKNLRAFNHFDSRIYHGTSLAGGDINNFVMIRKLLESGYRGPLTIENTSPGDKRAMMTEDLAYLKAIIAELTAELVGETR
jgi:sugar phosphate isomerase/epimerase